MIYLFPKAFGAAMQGAYDSLPDMLLLCACLGAFDAAAEGQKKGHPGCRQIVVMGQDEGLIDLMSITLEQAMQVVIYATAPNVESYSMRTCMLNTIAHVLWQPFAACLFEC